MKTEKKAFAFKLAEKNNEKVEQKIEATKWQAREGLSVAGCTDPAGQGNYRDYRTGIDNGVWC